MPYTPPEGDLVPFDFVGPVYVPPEGDVIAFDFTEDPGGGTGDTQYVFPSTFDSTSIGSAQLRNQRDYLRPAGWTQQAYGTPAVRNNTQIVRPSAIASIAMPAQSIMLKHRPLAPSGFVPFAAGSPTIINRNRTIYAGNLSAPAFGAAPQVTLYTRYLIPAGLPAALYGSLTASHGRRQIQLAAGISPPDIGAAWVSMSPRRISPSGAFIDAVGRPMVGGTRYLSASGWDSAAFGSRIIPESQALYPLGLVASQWGSASVKNWKTKVLVSGWQSTGQEQYRWGMPRAFNLRQYIAQVEDQGGELAPMPFGQWTEIKNRNRVLSHFGTAPPSMGYPQIDNNARPLLPIGIAAPSVPGGTATHRVRPVQTEGIAPIPVSYWLNVRNAARVSSAIGFNAALIGGLTIFSNRRNFSGIGGIAPEELGTPFIADRVRMLDIESRYGISPPQINLPDVKLYTRYIEGIGFDTSRVGLVSLVQRRNLITPRWTHREYVGSPEVKNKTPMLRTFGRNAEEFGTASVDLHSRYLIHDGASMQLFGRARISDTKQKISISGANFMAVSDKLIVTKTGAPPYSPQNVIIDHEVDSASVFGVPGLNQFVLRPEGFNASTMSAPAIREMGIRMDAGIKIDAYGTPAVGLKRREIFVSEWPDDQIYEPSTARISPHTIYAVKEAPAQAVTNHPLRNLHYIGETTEYAPGARFGTPRIRKPNLIENASAGNQFVGGQASIALRRKYITPTGILAFRMGVVGVSDGVDQVEQFGAKDSMEFGRPTIAKGPVLGPQYIRPAGLSLSVVSGSTWISLKHRTFTIGGFMATQMGASGSDSPYQWQRLHIGPPMPTIPIGISSSAFGTAWISLRVRGVSAQGFDASDLGYTPSQFAARMRVLRGAGGPVGPASRSLTPVGIAGASCGVPNVRNGVHFIRPDGNSEQLRKGAF